MEFKKLIEEQNRLECLKTRDELTDYGLEMLEELNQALQSLQSCVMSWISCDERLPMCYSTGNWDGKKSDNFIGETITGKQFIGCCYEGTMDGSKFFDWYQVDELNSNDWTINETVSRWLPIPF